MPAETATAVCCILMGGVLKKFPKLKVKPHIVYSLSEICFIRFVLLMAEEHFLTLLGGSSMDTRWTKDVEDKLTENATVWQK